MAPFTRRRFVSGAAAAAFGATVLPRHVLGGSGFRAPSDRLNIAVVGAGGRGANDAAALVEGGETIVALADIDFGHVDRTVEGGARRRDGQPNPAFVKLQEAYGKARRYADFRRMLDAQQDIDAVLIATPDHLHAVAAAAAMERGKHVYVEKPLTYTVQEARMLAELAARTKVVTQMGNQGHSTDEARLINEWVQAGLIGPVSEVHVWTNRPIWPQGVPRPAASAQVEGGVNWGRRNLSAEFAAAMAGDYAPPAGLNWDLFLGPAPYVPYHPIYHPFNWRGWVDWGVGALGDMGAHLIDHPFWALGLGLPTAIEATSTPFGLDAKGAPASYPLATTVHYTFDAPAAGQPPVRLTWYDGGLMPARPAVLPEDVPIDRGGGVFIVGAKGILYHKTYGADPQLYPQALMSQTKQVAARYPRVPTSHQMNWALACKGEAEASSPFAYAAPLTETMLLGVVALRTGQGKKIHYDGRQGQVTNIPEANQHLARPSREGWALSSR